MTFLVRLAPSAQLERWAAVEILVIFGLVATSALVARAGLRRQAAARYEFWLLTLLLVIVSPLAVVVADRSGIGRWSIALARADFHPAPAATRPLDSAPEPPRDAGPEAPPPASVARELVPLAPGDWPAPGSGPPPLAGPGTPTPAVTPEAPPAPAVSPAWSRADAAGLAVAAWLLGGAVGLVRLVAGARGLTRVRRGLRPLDLAPHSAALDRVRAAVGFDGLPPILVAAAGVGPFAAGLLRPFVVVPSDLHGGGLRDVLVHEVAHVARGDLWVGLLQRLVGIIGWPHPAIYLLNRHLNRAREEVCDNFVLRAGDPRAYARTLLALTVRRPAAGGAHPALGLTGAGWTLADRVAGLLDPERNRMTRSPLRVRVLTAALLLGVGLPLATVRFDRPAVVAAASAVPQVEAPPGTAGRPVTGVVVDANGRPVAGAIVHPIRRSKALAGATTDPAGRFTLTLRGYMLLTEELIAEADNGNLLGLGKFEESRSTAPAEPVRITLKPRRAVTVRVRDATGGPVAGAAVETIDFCCDRQATTGPDGTAVVRVPADARVRWVIAHKGGVGFDYFENYRTKPARNLEPVPAEVTLTLDGAATVRVRAVDSAGRPVAGVKFDPWYVEKPGKLDHANIGGGQTVSATTGPDGVATFDWLPARVEQGVPFLFHEEDYACPEELIYDGPGATELTAHLLRNTPISGFVRRADGQPGRNVLVQAEGHGPSRGSSGYYRGYARTTAEGRYWMNVPPELTYAIAVADNLLASRSLANVRVREGEPRERLDLALVPGTLVQGQVTREPDRTPVAGRAVALDLYGKVEFDRPDPTHQGDPDLQYVVRRLATTDADGRYQFRAGPGNHRLGIAGTQAHNQNLGVTGPDAATETRDIHLTEPEPPAPFAGRVVERRADGDRPVADATVEAVNSLASRGWVARSDADGRFRGERQGVGALVFYARKDDGALAGYATFEAAAPGGEVIVRPATRVSGRVVDSAGQPRRDYKVQVEINTGPDVSIAGRYFRQLRTDDQGRYTLDGVVVGSRGEASIRSDGKPPYSSSPGQFFQVSGEAPVEIHNLVIPAEPTRPPAPQVAALTALRIAPTVTTRAEIEALVRSIGRDAATPELIDRVLIPFLPQNTWPYDLARVRRLVLDDRFGGRVDALSLDRVQHPADTLTLMQVALDNLDTGDDAAILDDLTILDQDRQAPLDAIQGTVEDAASGQPVAGAVVQTPDALTRTDDRGRFRLRSRGRPGILFRCYVAAEGYGLRALTLAQAGANLPPIRLAPAVPVQGRVVDPAGRPIAGATLHAWVARSKVVGRPLEPRDGGGTAEIIAVRSDDQGGFAVPNVPPFDEHFSLRVTHPTFQPGGIEVEPPGSSSFVIRLQPGAVVGGVVVDEDGRGVAAARVHRREPGSDRDETSVSTDDQGRYRFADVRPGRCTLIIVADQFAPVQVAVVASPDRPVENQVVVPPGLFVRGQVVGPDGMPVAGALVGWVKSATDPGFSFDRSTKAEADGTFKLGPLPAGEFVITGLAGSPRREGKVTARANQTDALIRLAPDPPR